MENEANGIQQANTKHKQWHISMHDYEFKNDKKKPMNGKCCHCFKQHIFIYVQTDSFGEHRLYNVEMMKQSEKKSDNSAELI